MNDLVLHRADETKPFVAHDFSNEMRVHAPHTFGDRTQEVHVQPAGREFQDVLESLFLNRAKHCRLRGRSHGGMRLTAQKRIFAEKVAGLNIIEHFLPAAAALLGNFDRTFTNQIKRIAQIAFLENDIAALESKDVDVGPDSLQDFVADAFEKPVAR